MKKLKRKSVKKETTQRKKVLPASLGGRPEPTAYRYPRMTRMWWVSAAMSESQTKETKLPAWMKPNADSLVMEDPQRPCLFGVAGPCVHPKCLETHARTIEARLRERYE